MGGELAADEKSGGARIHTIHLQMISHAIMCQ